MPSAHALLASWVLVPSLAARRVDVDMSASGEPQPGLRVFASTFNAGNQIYKGTDGRFERMLDSITEGHNDADIVLMGFQEFDDSHYGFADFAKKILWRDSSQERLRIMNTELKNVMTAPDDVMQHRDELHAYLTKADTHVDEALAAFDVEAIHEQLEPVEQWAQQTLSVLSKVWHKYPNLQHTTEGSQLWTEFTNSLQHVNEVKQRVIARVKILQALEGNSDLLENEGNQRTVLQHWNQLEEALANLQRDVAGTSVLANWTSSAREEADRLLRLPEFTLRPQHLDVGMSPARFSSGFRCRAGAHYDTMMYAFVSPWSEWRIRLEHFERPGSVCRADDDSKSVGCNIDNNNGMECGKVVNLLRFRATRGGQSIRLCAMNTHMSFKGSARKRADYISEAMRVAREASCESVVFVGDFNSRLHCQQDASKPGELPAYERTEATNSMDYVLNLFRNDSGKIALSGSPHAHVDELSQMLASELVSCFEESVDPDSWWGKKKIWELELHNSGVASTGLFEAPVHFAPTYKLGPENKLGKAKFWACEQGEDMCYINPSGKGKHNPAWADRVLLQADPKRATIHVEEYSRRLVPPTFGSDHLPVVGKLVIHPLQGAV